MKLGVCRTCVRKCRVGQSIWAKHEGAEISLATLLNRCAGLSITPEDGLSQKICERCYQKLARIFAFITQCKRAHRVLCRKINKTVNTIDTDVDIKTEPDYESSNEKSDDLEQVSSVKSSNLDISVIEKNELTNVEYQKRTRNIVSKRHPSQRLTCISCNFVSKSISQLKSHVIQFHSDPYGRICHDCPICSRRFKRKSELIVHLRIHSGEKPFACNYCPMRFTQSGTLIEHKRMHTGETPFSCKLCSRTFGSRSTLWRHRIVHTKERPYSCEICGKSFSHSSTLKHHRDVHSEERPHTCDICGKATKSKYALQQHMFIHSEKTYVCEQCGKKFSSKANLDQHIRKMHSIYAGKCHFCKKNTSNLAEHMMIHSNKSIYKCNICDKTFRMKNGLSLHITLHNNAEKYKCTIEGCTKAFPKQNMLNFHMLKMHSNETPHICQYCSKGYLRISDLTRHLNSFHSDMNAISIDSSTLQVK